MIAEYDTIAAISTAVVSAGIGIIRISGDEAKRIISEIFVPVGKKNNDMISHHIYYGNVMDGDDIIDECIVFLMEGPKSYTREDVVEIQCHGGIGCVSRILELVLSKGARAAEPGEFTKRAFLNGRIDMSQAESVMDLIGAKNELSRKNSIRQLKGGLSEKIREIRSEIIYEIAFIESALDDPEHISLDGYPEKLGVLAEKWMVSVDRLINTYDDGRMINEGIRTCIVGKPNAGKSSFLNALLGEERAIVTDIAGTTRDTLEECINVSGITLNMIDTAGIRDTSDTVEKIGVERARKEIDKADLVLCILDTSSDLSEDDIDILHSIEDKKKIIILNKSDITQKYGENELKEYIGDADCISVSAKYHTGLNDFTNVLKNLMFHGKIENNDQLFITNARHKNALDHAYHSLKCVKESIAIGMPEDFFTIDMMNAYEELGKIVGESLEEDLVNEIFSKFCTGK